MLDLYGDEDSVFTEDSAEDGGGHTFRNQFQDSPAHRKPILYIAFYADVHFSIKGFRFLSGSGFSVRLTNVADPDIKNRWIQISMHACSRRLKQKKC